MVFLPPPVLRGRDGEGAVSRSAVFFEQTPSLTLPRSTGGGDQIRHKEKLHPRSTHSPGHAKTSVLCENDAAAANSRGGRRRTWSYVQGLAARAAQLKLHAGDEFVPSAMIEPLGRVGGAGGEDAAAVVADGRAAGEVFTLQGDTGRRGRGSNKFTPDSGSTWILVLHSTGRLSGSK